MKQVLFVFGTRPEAIKMAPVIKEFQKYPDRFAVKICVTAQHRQMLDQALEVFGLKADYDLNIMAPGQDLYDITSRVLLGMREVLQDAGPELVFVHGDTATALAAALAAFYHKARIAHVEAGLRTYRFDSPWPEEMNRQLTDRISDYCFAPTEMARENLLRERIDPEKIFVTGNTVIDALFMALDIIQTRPGLEESLLDHLAERGYRPGGERKFMLVTGHRRENFGEGFLNICGALKTIARNHPEIDIVYPVHLNPQVQQPVYGILSGLGNVYLTPPLDYLPFVLMMRHSHLILTDSGGVQEEAPSLGKPVLVTRDTTERPEAAAAGTVKLVGTSGQAIVEHVGNLLRDEALYRRMAEAHNPYGDGRAAERLAAAV
jgi:UDP-N-acetylglucosamine 2-epimerase (non-hydrolysing)